MKSLEEKAKIIDKIKKLKILQNILIVAGLFTGACGLKLIGDLTFNKPKLAVEQIPIPKPTRNQQLILHPAYLRGAEAMGYTLLTDIDYDGQWDLAERYRVGFTTGDGSHELIYKEGYGPSQTLPEGIKVKQVNRDLFSIIE